MTNTSYTTPRDMISAGNSARRFDAHFRKFGADVYVVDLVGILVLREIGVLLIAIMSAGRSGSSYTAELGSMKMREEIDALRTIGVPPIELLVLPKALALMIALQAVMSWDSDLGLGANLSPLMLSATLAATAAIATPGQQ